jgi:hypothetical protein
LVHNFCEGFVIDISAKAKAHLDEIYDSSGKWMVIDHPFLLIFDDLDHPQSES